MRKDIIVILMPAGKPMSISTVQNTLEDMMRLVGGYLQGLRLRGGLYLYFDEEGKVGKKRELLKDNIPLQRGDIVVGDAVVCRVTAEGDWDSVTDDDIEWVKENIDQRRYKTDANR